MIKEQTLEIEVQRTPRREARDKFARYLLLKVGLEELDIEVFLNTKQAVLENKSPLELIYTGDYERGMEAVYTLVDSLSEEEI